MKARSTASMARRFPGAGAFVLVLGLGSAPLAAANTWITTGSLNTAEFVSTGILLHDNTVLAIAGGPLRPDTSELYDPATGTWREIGPVGPGPNGRGSFAAVLLRDGRVLVIGGYIGAGASRNCRIYDPASGLWGSAGALNVGRWEHTATLLEDGRVLAVGGRDISGNPLASAEIYDPGTDLWTLTNPLTTARRLHTATFLPGTPDRVMVTGGRIAGNFRTATTEVFDTSTLTWSAAGPLTTARNEHSATLLPNGRVLVAGGDSTESAELFDPSTLVWTPTGSLPEVRFAHTATLMPSGLVLIAAGRNAVTLQTALTYDYTTGQFTAKADLNVKRYMHSATMLPDGRVLVAGGYDSSPLKDAELYDGETPDWPDTSVLSESRSESTATPLLNGKALIVGGAGRNTSEVFDPATGLWSLSATTMNATRLRHTTTLLPDGQVLAAGTSSSIIQGPTAELYDPGDDDWTATGTMAEPRYEHTATLLPCGEVLVVGGERTSGVVHATAERYNPRTGTWRSTGSLIGARLHHTATLLANGRVLVTGGFNAGAGGSLATAEIYDPVNETWTPTAGPMTAPRHRHTATLLPNGRVLLVGGQDARDSADEFDPGTGTFVATGAPTVDRDTHYTATLLPNGRVLVVGGFSNPSRAEVYDPATRAWRAAPNTTSLRRRHATALLPDGRVLVAGGSDLASGTTAELYDVGRGELSGWRPTLSSVTTPLVEGSPLTATGLSFEGLGEASTGLGDQHSASNYPLVQLQHVDSERVRWLLVGPGSKWTDTSFGSEAVTGCVPGPTRATVFTNGIPSISRFTIMECPPPVITASPAGQEACVGGSLSFTVAATGDCGTFVWRKDTTPLVEGAPYTDTRTDTLILSGVTLAEAGSYDAIAELSCSSSTDLSAAASLTIHDLLSGVTAGLSGTDTVCTTCLGGTFTEGHSDGGPVTHQWGHRLTSGGTTIPIPGQTGASYVLNGGDFPGPGSYYVVVTTSPLCGASQDSNEIPVTVTALTPAADVPYFTVTSRNQENVLEWVYPGGTLDVRIRYTSGPTCTPPTDALSSGTLLVDQTGVVPGQKDSFSHAPLTNGTTYCYSIFAGAGPWTAGRANRGRPMDTSGPVKWAFSTGVFTITAPTVGGSGILTTSNDNVVHAMERGLGGGEWPGPWKPVDVDGAVQSRPPVVPVDIGAANPVGYLATQSGSVYVIDAVEGSAAVSPYPWPAVTPTSVIQAAPAGMFSDFGGTYNYLLVGSRVGGSDNEVYAVDALLGGVIDTFDNGGGASAIGIVNGMGSVDYANDRFYFASHDRGGGTLWCLDLSGPPVPLMSYRWSRALGDIDSSPVQYRGAIYVGSPLGGGTLYAVEAADGLPGDDRTFVHNDGQVKGFVFPDRLTGDLYFATDNLVWALNDDGTTITETFAGGITLAGGVVPTSPVLFIPGSSYVYVGGSDGQLYEIEVSGGAPAIKSLLLGGSPSAVGAPSFDRVNNLLHGGTEAGVFYAVAIPFP